MRRLYMVAFLLLALAGLAGCATTAPARECPECGVAGDTGDLQLCPQPPYLPPPVLPSWPVPPGPDATDEQLNEWYARCEATVKARERILIEDGLTCREALQAYASP